MEHMISVVVAVNCAPHGLTANNFEATLRTVPRIAMNHSRSLASGYLNLCLEVM